MTDPASPAPCVFVVGDAGPLVELVGALSEPLPTTVVSKIALLSSSGGDEAIELFAARRPHVVVLTASLETGDAVALVEAMRGIVPRPDVGIVVVGDPEGGAIRQAADAAELGADRFVSRPMAPRTLRFAVASALEAVILARAARAAELAPVAEPVLPALPPVPPPPSVSAPPEPEVEVEVEPELEVELEAEPEPEPEPEPPPVPEPLEAEVTRETLRRRWETLADSMADAEDDPDEDEPVLDEAASLRRRWEALADSIADAEGDPDEDEPPLDEAAPLPPPIAIRPRGAPPGADAMAPPQAWSPGTTSALEAPPREPTLIIRDPSEMAPPAPIAPPVPAPMPVFVPAPGDPIPLAALLDRDRAASLSPVARDAVPPAVPRSRSGRILLPDLDADPTSVLVRPPMRPDLDLPIDDLILGGGRGPEPRIEVVEDIPDAAPPAPSSTGDGRDFARQLRAKMSQMAQRLFQGADAPAPAPADLVPRHDHSTEFDLSSLGEEPPLGGVTEIEARASARMAIAPELVTSPGSWDSQVRERGLPDQGEIVRGVSDAPMLLAKMFAGGSTGRIAFRRGEVETMVFFDQGRPVFASSSETRDRMGELLVREGKITASQYERCQGVVAESGRRMGEILVDFGYLKRRELLPAVRRHVEDILYALFGWDSGRYQISIEAQPSAERIRLSRHPAALILEGIRRKLNRTTLERLIGPPSTVIEVADRERLGGIINMGDLSSEERAALSAFDAQTDLAQVARTAGVDPADALPLAWGLCVLGLAAARRTDTEVHDEGTALVGETDLAIDRERVRARWQLVTEADYFALLGVRRDATTFEIRRAYQAARRDFAAEGFPSDLRRELARELDDIAHVLDEAFRVLRDDRLRQTYLANLVE